MEAIQYCGGIASVHVGDSISTVGDSISTVEAIQLANQKLSAIYNFETKIVLDFYCN